jgi:type IX secretion system PorP/SprF family membrane protein
MKKTLLIFAFLLSFLGETNAQARKYFGQFSHLQNYYNPGLTGYEGSTVRGLVRNQWVGFDDAPKTFFLSAEIDFGELGNSENPDLLGRNAIGVTVLQDQYGPFEETELIISYASRIRLSKSTSLRLGAGVNYGMVRLDGHRLTTKQLDDPTVSIFQNTFARMSTLDFNVGMALTHKNYYVSYGAHNVNRGGFNAGDVYWEKKPVANIFQAGYRSVVSDNVSIIANFMYRQQADLPVNAEFNFKALLMDRLWLGAGHRVNYANNFQIGFLFPKMTFGYIHEMPLHQSYLLPNSTHEFILTHNLFRKNIRQNPGDVMIW